MLNPDEIEQCAQWGKVEDARSNVQVYKPKKSLFAQILGFFGIERSGTMVADLTGQVIPGLGAPGGFSRVKCCCSLENNCASKDFPLFYNEKGGPTECCAGLNPERYPDNIIPIRYSREQCKADEVGEQRWATFFREGVARQYSATCKNDDCEPFEICTPTSCAGGKCTEDCGGLYCPEDCEKEDDDGDAWMKYCISQGKDESINCVMCLDSMCPEAAEMDPDQREEFVKEECDRVCSEDQGDNDDDSDDDDDGNRSPGAGAGGGGGDDDSGDDCDDEKPLCLLGSAECCSDGKWRCSKLGGGSNCPSDAGNLHPSGGDLCPQQIVHMEGGQVVQYCEARDAEGCTPCFSHGKQGMFNYCCSDGKWAMPNGWSSGCAKHLAAKCNDGGGGWCPNSPTCIPSSTGCTFKNINYDRFGCIESCGSESCPDEDDDDDDDDSDDDDDDSDDDDGDSNRSPSGGGGGGSQPPPEAGESGGSNNNCKKCGLCGNGLFDMCSADECTKLGNCVYADLWFGGLCTPDPDVCR